MLFAGINPTKGMWNQTVVLKTITDFKAARNLTQAQEQGITQLALDAQVRYARGFTSGQLLIIKLTLSHTQSKHLNFFFGLCLYAGD